MRLRHPDGLELLGIAIWGLCLLAPVGDARAAGENLVPNPSFEELNSDGHGPADWQFSWKNTHSNDAEHGVEKQKPGFTISEAEASHGRRSVKIEVARPQDDGVLTAPTIRVDPSVRIYRASVWIKTQGLTETTARLVAVSLGEGGKWLGADYSLIAELDQRP